MQGISGVKNLSNVRKMRGMLGEDLACEYLIKTGYKIVARNYRCSLGELDIIAQDGKTLVFVEVRTRSSAAFGIPEESIDWRKKKKLKQLAFFYLSTLSEPAAHWRIDVIAVEINRDDSPKTIRHIKSAI